jgi:hypothetical protein
MNDERLNSPGVWLRLLAAAVALAAGVAALVVAIMLVRGVLG